MSRQVVFRPIARQELEEAVAWYERQKPGLGVELKESVELIIARIAATP